MLKTNRFGFINGFRRVLSSETFEDTKGVIRNRKSKDKQYNGQMNLNLNFGI